MALMVMERPERMLELVRLPVVLLTMAQSQVVQQRGQQVALVRSGILHMDAVVAVREVLLEITQEALARITAEVLGVAVIQTPHSPTVATL